MSKTLPFKPKAKPVQAKPKPGLTITVTSPARDRR